MVMPTLKKESTVTEKNAEYGNLVKCVKEMGYLDALEYIMKPRAAGEAVIILSEGARHMFSHELVDDAVVLAKLRVSDAIRNAELYEADRKIIEEEPTDQTVGEVKTIIGRMDDRDLVEYFLDAGNKIVGSFRLTKPSGNSRNYGQRFMKILGKAVADRLALPRVGPNDLVIDLGDCPVVNPVNAMTRFMQALTKRIEEGPETPAVADPVAPWRISEEWVIWYRRTNSCGFDVAWHAGAQAIARANHGDETNKYTYYPDQSDQYIVRYYLKLGHNPA